MSPPLTLPDGFNPKTNMIARDIDGKTYHCIVPAVRLAYALMENGHTDDIAQAEKTLWAVIHCQETNDNDPHHGNFYWEREDGFVEDLNAVQFALFNLIPIMIQYGNKLPETLQTALRQTIRIGLQEIMRIDVNVAYTNIVIKDITNSCLGGELLGDKAIAKRGYNKMKTWMQLTDANGIPVEFNSPNYARIAVTVLHMLSDLVQDEATRMRALVMRNRLTLSTMLHIHHGTGRLAGPYSRGYLQDVFAITPPEIYEVRRWIDDGIIPDWFTDALDNRPIQFQIRETAERQSGVDITTYHSNSFVLGVSSQELTTQSNRFIAKQSNVCIAHYVVPEQERAGVFLTRYLHNDRWVGDFRSTPSRSPDFLLPEEGRFIGTQDKNRMIGFYAPTELDGWNRCHSAKGALIWLNYDTTVEGIWIDGTVVHSLPAPIDIGQTIVVSTGSVYFAVRPLSLTDLGRDARMQLTLIDNNLVLEMPNYRGASKTFWELAYPGSFYQGQPQCGFYLEIAEKSDYSDAVNFGDVVTSGQLSDIVDPVKTHEKGTQRLWRASYQRDGQEIGLEIDLMTWELKRRWTHQGDLGWHMLESPIANQNRTGEIIIGEATLQWDTGETAWLLAFPEQHKWIACYHGDQVAHLTLKVPNGHLEIDEIACGWIVWDNETITIEARRISSKLDGKGATLA